MVAALPFAIRNTQTRNSAIPAAGSGWLWVLRLCRGSLNTASPGGACSWSLSYVAGYSRALELAALRECFLCRRASVVGSHRHQYKTQQATRPNRARPSADGTI